MRYFSSIYDRLKHLSSRWKISGKFLFVFVAGCAYAAALAPFNLCFLAFFTITALLCAIENEKPLRAALLGWVWGIGWSFFSYRFLREIDPIIPFLLPEVISIWPAVWCLIVSILMKKSFQDPPRRGSLLFFTFGSAALFTLIEWSRSRLFVWNDLSVTQWRNLPLIQLASVTGSYGVGFIVALVNTALFILLRKRALKAATVPLLTAAAVMLWGYCRLTATENFAASKSVTTWSPLLIQGNLSQRRHATIEQALEAMNIYGTMSLQGLNKYPDSRFIIWPESAVPLTFYSSVDMRKYTSEDPFILNHLKYQQLIRLLTENFKCRMLIGAIDLAPVHSGDKTPYPTNSALFFDEHGRLRHKYNKIHRVPFGEYIPFRKFIPSFITRYIDMGRDIVSGTDHSPVRLAPQVNAGIAICYEGVFGYITRKAAQQGANILIVLSNDAWYPQSSEPEQHLANAVMRAVETGLPMIRSGNNGGSGVVTPTGRFTQCYSENAKRPELWRGSSITRVNVDISPEIRRTVYVKHGEFFIAILAFIVSGWLLYLYCPGSLKSAMKKRR